MFQKFREYDLKFKPKSGELFRRRVEFLGRQVSRTGEEIGDKYIEAVRNWVTSPYVKDVDRSYCHRAYLQGDES